MHICIDARISRGSWLTGVGQYTINLVDQLARLAPDNIYTILVHPAAAPIPVREPERFRIVALGVSVGSIKQYLWMPRWVKSQGIDVILHTHAVSALIAQPCTSVTVILDVYPLRFPQYFGLAARLAYKFLVPKAVQRSQRCIAISQCTKQDAVSFLSLTAEQIDVVYLAASDIFRPIAKGPSLHETLRAYGIDRPYILYHGNKRPHKNVVGLLRGFSQLKRQRASPHGLVITGEENSKEPEFDSSTLRRMIGELGIESEVHFTGLVSEEDLPYIYSGADLLAIPSYYEGFGLSALEAMACGTPVVVSNRGAFPEVVADAGLLVDPYDTEALIHAIQLALEDEPLRLQLSSKGLERAKLFSWQKTAGQTLRILEDAVSSWHVRDAGRREGTEKRQDTGW